MIDVRPTTSADIRHVVYRMWRRGVEELRCHGHFDKEAIIRELCVRSAEYGYTFYHCGEPIAIVGANTVGANAYHTWFSATDKFHYIGKEATRFLKKLTADKTAERPEATLELWTTVNHPDADRWFKLLGFQPLEPQPPFSRYLYAPRKRLTTEAK